MTTLSAVEPVYDLLQLANVLEKRGGFVSLVKAIRQGHAAASAASDLMRAEQHLDLIARVQQSGGMPSDFSAEEGGSLISGLFVAAVIIYARATVITPIDRWPWWNPSKLSAELRKIHDACVHLRNKEMAHFGRGFDIEGEPLLYEALYLRFDGDSPVNFHANSWATRPEFAVEMLKLVQSVHRSAKERMKSSFEAVAKGLGRAMSADSTIRLLAKSFPILDPRFHQAGEKEAVIDGPHLTKVWTTVNTRTIENPKKP